MTPASSSSGTARPPVGSRPHAQLDPRPIGWFALARSAELRPGAEKRGVLAAAPYRLRRRADGQLEHDGSSVGALVEQNGFVFAWHHPRSEAPGWRIPALDEQGWRPMRHRLLRCHTHPQEVYENSIDTAHFPVIHGYSDISVLEPMQLMAHEMKVSYQIARRVPLPWVERKIVADFQVHLHGLGCAHNHIHVPAFGLRVRMFALATPTAPGEAEIRLGVALARATRLPLGGLVLPLVHRGVQHSIVNDFLQDMAVWEHKRYLKPPLLLKSDGPIASFRRWSTQFYQSEPAQLEVV